MKLPFLDIHIIRRSELREKDKRIEALKAKLNHQITVSRLRSIQIAKLLKQKIIVIDTGKKNGQKTKKAVKRQS